MKSEEYKPVKRAKDMRPAEAKELIPGTRVFIRSDDGMMYPQEIRERLKLKCGFKYEDEDAESYENYRRYLIRMLKEARIYIVDNGNN